ncbi:glycosyltransferase family 2 protein [Chloroflexota bacterium]
MAESPLVSVITPSYNTGRFIEETILSIKNQTYPHIEHIIMDGGSTDETLDIIRKYEGTYDMRWVSEPDKGQSDAINKGWRMAKGGILCWLNSDDSYLPDAVTTAVKYLEEHQDAVMVYGECNIIDECSTVTGRCQAKPFSFRKMLCRGNVVPQPASFWRRVVLERVGELDTGLHYVMDFDYWLRIALEYQIAYVPKYLANFRHCPGTKSISQSAKFAHDQLYVLDKLFAIPELPDKVKKLKSCAYGMVHFKIGAGYYAQRQMGQAREHLFKAIGLNPGIITESYIIPYLLLSFFRGRGG